MIEESSLMYLGEYYGYNTNDPSNKFTIKIDSTSNHEFSPLGEIYYISNLPEGNILVYKPWGAVYGAVLISPGWSYFYIQGLAKTGKVEGWCFYENNSKSIKIDYSFNNYDSTSKINTTFLGIKIK